MQFKEDPPPQGLSEARRGRAVFADILTDTNPPPRRFNYFKDSSPILSRVVMDASRTSTIFHGLGENHSRSRPFLQSRLLFMFISHVEVLFSFLNQYPAYD